jgi:hypothetical protein
MRTSNPLDCRQHLPTAAQHEIRRLGQSYVIAFGPTIGS